MLSIFVDTSWDIDIFSSAMKNEFFVVITILLWSGIYAITTPKPNLGDIRLKNPITIGSDRVYGILQVYFSEGSSSPTWSSVCSPHFGKQYEGNTTCHQLGYQTCNNVKSDVKRTDSDPVWLTNIYCNQKTFDHIFHCEHDLITNNTCTEVIGIYCEKKLEAKDLYYGQVALCAPDKEDQNLTVQSVSMGIVSINFYGEFGALSFNRSGKSLTEEITHYRGNLICQQQGFQQVVPGSIQTVASYKDAGYEFTNCAAADKEGIYISTSWISNRNLTCESKNYKDDDCTSTSNDPCFSCCYTQPSPNSKIQTDFDNYIVLQCIFDVYTKKDSVPYGTQSKCEFPKDYNKEGQYILDYHNVCAAGKSHQNSEAFYIIWLVLSLFIILSLLIYIVIPPKYKKCQKCKKCENKDYYEIGDDRQQPNPQENSS